METKISRNWLLKPSSKRVVVHYCETRPKDFNRYAKKSLTQDNDAKRRATDEAMSIHIITKSLSAWLAIKFEADIRAFYGKPDYIIRLGKNTYIMVSATRAINRKNTFSQEEANRLVRKKIDGLRVYEKNLECYVEDAICDYKVIAILHILAPTIEHKNKCLAALDNIPKNIKVIVSVVKHLVL